MINFPLVSILMTAYNRESYLAEAIESVLKSSYSNFELIIVDDASSDNSLIIAHSYSDRDSRIRVYKNEINLGDYRNRNKAASYAKGVYLMNVDSDDKLYPNTIMNCIIEMEKHPDVSFGISCSRFPFVEAILTPDFSIRTHFFDKPFLLVGPGGTIIRNMFFKKIGGFPIKYGPANDGYYNLKVACSTKTLIFPFDFVYYRRHEGQEINNRYAYLYNSYRYLNDALVELNLALTQQEISFLRKKNKRRFITNILKYFLQQRNFSKTIKAIRLAQFSVKDTIEGIFH